MELPVGLWQCCTLLKVLCVGKHSTHCPRSKSSHGVPSSSFLTLCEWHTACRCPGGHQAAASSCGKKPGILCAHTSHTSSPHIKSSNQIKSGGAFYSYFSRWPCTGWEGRRVLCSALSCIGHSPILQKHLSYRTNFPAFFLEAIKIKMLRWHPGSFLRTHKCNAMIGCTLNLYHRLTIKLSMPVKG